MSNISLASTGPSGIGDNDSGYEYATSVSGDGRYVAFVSGATNLVAGDTNNALDIFVRDTVTGITTLVSQSSGGLIGDGSSFAPSISANGRYVAFQSTSTNLGADGNGQLDIFVRDLQLGTTTLVPAPGALNGGSAFDPSISADGRFVAFTEDSTFTFEGQVYTQLQVFLRDLELGTTTLVSAGPNGAEGDNSTAASVSAHGRYVAFQSSSSNLVAGDTNGAADIFVRDMQLGTVTLVSTGPNGIGDFGSGAPDISGDGRYVAFESAATNLAAGDTNNITDIYVRDLVAGTTTLVSSGPVSVGNNYSSEPSISDDGRLVAFASFSTNIALSDSNGTIDVFVRDLQSSGRTLVSRGLDGFSGNGISNSPVISADGTHVAFASSASNLFAGDANGFRDVFSAVLDSPDVQTGGPGNDTLTGGPGSDTLHGADGDDTLIGTPSPAGTYNQLLGDAGSDTASYLGTSAAVYADLRPGAGYVGGVLQDLFVSIENLTGGSGNDLLVGDDFANVLRGGGGTDQMFGLGGDDTFIGGAAGAGTQNQLFGGDGIDTVDYLAETASVYVELRAPAGYVGGVLVDLMNSIENARGGSGDDVLVGTDADNNLLVGNAGTDLLFGFGGDDVLIGGAAGSGQYNQLFGGEGSDTASYVGAITSVYAELTIFAGYAVNPFGGGFVLRDVYNSVENLTGGFGADTLAGDAGANVITGGGGGDTLYGRGGTDLFVYHSFFDSNLGVGGPMFGPSYDTIADFSSADGDKLDFRSLGITPDKVSIVSGMGSTSVYVDTDAMIPGFDLAIALIGANAVTTGDILF